MLPFSEDFAPPLSTRTQVPPYFCFSIKVPFYSKTIHFTPQMKPAQKAILSKVVSRLCPRPITQDVMKAVVDILQASVEPDAVSAESCSKILGVGLFMI